MGSGRLILAEFDVWIIWSYICVVLARRQMWPCGTYSWYFCLIVEGKLSRRVVKFDYGVRDHALII